MSRLRTALLLCLLAPAVAAAQPESGNPINSRVGSSFNAAESLQGPLDGSWTLVGPTGQPIFAFQLVDKPGGQDPLEGVWRDLRHPAVPGDIGFIDSLVRGTGTLAITLNATPSGPAVTVSLHNDPTGGWVGTMRENAADVTVKLRRG